MGIFLYIINYFCISLIRLLFGIFGYFLYSIKSIFGRLSVLWKDFWTKNVNKGYLMIYKKSLKWVIFGLFLAILGRFWAIFGHF